MDETEDGDDAIFPWEDVDPSRQDRKLQRRHVKREARAMYGADAAPCPGCGALADDQAWFYFESPAETWELLCGRAGWMTVCDRCRRQVNYFEEVIS